MNSQWNRWWKLLTSMGMAIGLLIILGIAASLGTLVPQGVSSAFYTQHYGAFLGKILLVLGFDHLYSSWWFLGLGGLLGLNILFCSLQRLKKIGNPRETGSILVHLSILVIYLGAIISGFLGTSADINIAVGETKDLSEIGFPDYVLKVEDFRIEYYESMEPSQYLSALSLEESGGEKLSREIKVNYPLKYKGLKIYQQSYGWQLSGELQHENQSQPFRINEGEEFILNPQENLIMKTIFIPDYDEHTGSLYSRSPFPKNPRLACALIQDSKLLDVQSVAPGEKVLLGDYQVQFDDFRYYSGLNVKRDPGIPWIYSGFGLMFLGFLLRYTVPKHSAKGGKG